MSSGQNAQAYQAAWDQGQILVRTGVAFASLSTVAVVLRLFARCRHSISLGLDDLMISLSLLPLWALVAVGCVMAEKGGLGLQNALLSSSQSDVFYRTLYASNLLYALAISSVKISVLLLYRRVFTTPGFRLAVWLVGGLSLLWFLVVVLVSLFECQPVSFAWDKTLTGHCINLKAMYYGYTITNMIVCVVIIFMPTKVIWQLHLPMRQRILLLIIMSTGIIVFIISIGRILSVPYLVLDEVAATILVPFIFMILEPSLAIVSSCLPTYRPLFSWISKSVQSSRLSSKMRVWFSTSGSSMSSTKRNTLGHDLEKAPMYRDHGTDTSSRSMDPERGMVGNGPLSPTGPHRSPMSTSAASPLLGGDSPTLELLPKALSPTQDRFGA